MTGNGLDIFTRARGPLKVVAPVGELDLPGATRLLAIVGQLARTGSRVVVCDLSRLAVPPGTDHLLSVFPATQRRAGRWPYSALHLAAARRPVAHLLRRMGMPRSVPVHPTMNAALVAAAAEVAGSRRELAVMPDTPGPQAAREIMGQLWPDTTADQQARQDGVMVVCELTANAARHAGTPYTVSMALSATQFLVGVTDASRQQPIVSPIQPLAEGGRGLLVVSALSQAWGTRLIHQGGKTVWATIGRGDLGGSPPGTEVEIFAGWRG